MGCKIIAHRGSNKEAPQNTLSAFQAAVDEKADGFETDVHLTLDGVPVICHNYSIDDTSDGRGLVSGYTLAELKKFDFGSYFGERFRGTSAPTLDEFLFFVSKTSAEIINIELKCPADRVYELAKKTLDCVKKNGVLDRVIISSFSPALLRAVKAVDARCKTAFLFPSNRPSVCRAVFFNPFIIVKSTAAAAIHPMSVLVTPFMVKTAHKLGVKVNVWTVNDEKSVLRLLKMGVDGIITDCPGKVRSIVQKYESGEYNVSRK